MAQKTKLTATITKANLKTLQTKADKQHEGNLSRALRDILNEYADTHIK